MKNNYVFLVALVICSCFVSCKKNAGTATSAIIAKEINKQNLVEKDVALQLARHMTNNVFLEKTPKNTAAKPTSDSNLVRLKDIGNNFIIPDKKGNPALYVINYSNDSGFIIISADYRFQPVCAYTEHGHIDENDTIPPALAVWFGRTVEDIEMIRNGEYDNGFNGYHEWERWDSLITTLGFVNLEYQFPELPDPCIEPVIPVTVEPLLGYTAWGQGDGYNDIRPLHGDCKSNFINSCIFI